MAQKEKRITPKQRKAIEMLTCGEGYSYKQIAEEVGCNPKTLWEWRTQPEYVMFQQELERINNERWLATVDVARQAAIKLCAEGNQRMVEFVLKNEGYNPTQKVDAELHQDINITIGE